MKEKLMKGVGITEEDTLDAGVCPLCNFYKGYKPKKTTVIGGLVYMDYTCKHCGGEYRDIFQLRTKVELVDG